MKERLLQLIEFLQTNVSQFEKNISVSNGAIRNAMGRNRGLNSDVLSKILDVYPNISPDWLILGKGEMLRSDAQKTVSSSADSDKIWKEILADKDRRIEELIIENYKIREQVAKIQAVTPPPSRNGLINKALHIGTSDTSEPGNDNPKKQ